MAAIRIPKVLTQQSFLRLARAWKSSRNVTIQVPATLKEEDIRTLCRFLMRQLPNDFAAAVLSELAEKEDFPRELIEGLFERGDVACKVAVALRDDLPPQLVRKCLKSRVPDVVEHLKAKKRRAMIWG